MALEVDVLEAEVEDILEGGVADVDIIDGELDTGHAEFCLGRSIHGRWSKPRFRCGGLQPELLSSN